MHLVIARAANSSIASFALTHLSTVFRGDVTWLDPLAAAPRWAVNPVACCVLLELPVPSFLEVLVKKVVYVFQWYVFGGTAPGRHMSWISNRHGENALQTFVAHAVRAGEPCRTGNWYVIGTTSQTRDLLIWHMWCRE
jgi:hypothetical protein